MKKYLRNFLLHKGYMDAVTSLPEFSVFFLPENGTAEVITIIDYQKEIYLSEETYEIVRDRFIQSFKDKGFSNVHILTIVLCEDVSRIDSIFKNDKFCWYLNTKENNLYIPDNHIEDFYGIKSRIEDFLLGPEEFEEEFGAEIMESAHKPKRNFWELPFVNAIIILANILIFIVCVFTQDVLYYKGAFSIFVIEETKEYYRFITAIFLHADLSHLLSNMVVLYFLGNILEAKIGHIKYVILYFVSAMGGNLLSAACEIYFGEFFISEGASGAIFGIIGAVLIMVLTQGGEWENITLSRMLLMIVYSLYSGFMSENVNNAGHIGGFIAGLVLMGLYYMINRLRKKKEVLHEN